MPFYNQDDYKSIQSFAVHWLYSLLTPWLGENYADYPIDQYHQWCQYLDDDHRIILNAKNRHRLTTHELEKKIYNEAIKDFLNSIAVNDFELWDEGLGWLAFRLVRPNCQDGYPFSCKAWGPAKDVYSVWIPIVGFCDEQTINIMPGSHVKEHEKYLPIETKFCKDEYRLKNEPRSYECIRPTFKRGEALIFHPRLIHSEDITTGDESRFNLEFRIKVN